jgi:hypothetical protein
MEKHVESIKMWLLRRMMRISSTAIKTNTKTSLEEKGWLVIMVSKTKCFEIVSNRLGWVPFLGDIIQK